MHICLTCANARYDMKGNPLCQLERHVWFASKAAAMQAGDMVAEITVERCGSYRKKANDNGS